MTTSNPAPTPADDPRRSRVRKVLLTVLLAANLVVFGAIAVVWFAANRVASAVPTIPASDLDLAQEPAALSEPRTFLLIGSDSREGLDDLTNFGAVGGRRADVVILAQVVPREGRLQLLSLPRDLRVTWEGAFDKINATFAYGGAAGIVETVQRHTGLPVHHYIQVDFAGFAGIVDAIGGIEMTFPFPARDLKSGLDVAAGTQTLDGSEAISLARSRRYEEFREGAWVSVDANDIGRTRRQQDLLLAMITQIEPPGSIGGFESLLDALGGFVVTDAGLDAEDILQLAWELRGVDASTIDSVTLPVRGVSEGGASYVTELEPQASNVLAAFTAGTPLEEAATVLKVEVENGNGRPGAASGMSEVLSGLGYEVVASIDSGRFDYSTTLVIARPSELDAAAALVDALGYGAAVSGRIPAGADLVVIVGADAPAP
jgi:LCP family protein required for cell wall assembly